MKDIKNILIIGVIIASTWFSGCRVAPTNGDLDAQWQIMSIVYNETGDEIHPQQKYYCIYRNLVQLAGTTGELVMHDNKLSFHFPYITTEQQIESLKDWGIDSPDPIFDIVELNSRRMVLKSDFATITFRRF